jgi:hypothetical protein
MSDIYNFKPGRIGSGLKVHLVRVYTDGRIGGALCGLDRNSKATRRRMAAGIGLISGMNVNCTHCLAAKVRIEQRASEIDAEFKNGRTNLGLDWEETYTYTKLAALRGEH